MSGHTPYLKALEATSLFSEHPGIIHRGQQWQAILQPHLPGITLNWLYTRIQETFASSLCSLRVCCCVLAWFWLAIFYHMPCCALKWVPCPAVHSNRSHTSCQCLDSKACKESVHKGLLCIAAEELLHSWLYRKRGHAAPVDTYQRECTCQWGLVQWLDDPRQIEMTPRDAQCLREVSWICPFRLNMTESSVGAHNHNEVWFCCCWLPFWLVSAVSVCKQTSLAQTSSSFRSSCSAV